MAAGPRVRPAAGAAVVSLALTLVFFLLAGRWDLPMLWAYAAALSGSLLLGAWSLDPERIRERFRQRSGGLDPGALALIRLTFGLHWVVALLDVGRLHASDRVPAAVQVAALAATAAALRWVLRCVQVNPFFVPVVRIQTERGHRLVTDGPYRLVRHPGYLGMILLAPASALALGSWCSLAPALACGLLVLRRTAVEDRFLKEHLAGYALYARATRHRLVPGLW